MLPSWRSQSDTFKFTLYFKSSVAIVLLLSFLFVSYIAFFSFSDFPCPLLCSSKRTNLDLGDPPSANISHVFFAIASSADTWNRRRAYGELWWRPGSTRGYAWLDREPSRYGGSSTWPRTSPPYRVSDDASRFGPRVSAARIARIVSEAYKVMVENSTLKEEVRWLVLGDDDTVFFIENLVSVLEKYDHREMYYIGGSSETVDQAVLHSYGMAFGGGGIAFSFPAAAEISKILDRCLLRYSAVYGGDQRIHACMTELGVPLTREAGFHQMDLRGDPYGMLAAHPVTPLVTLHHLDYVRSLFPGKTTQLEAIKLLLKASDADPSRTLQQSICYVPQRNMSVSVSWGYTVQIYPRILSPKELVTPLQTFQTWKFQNSPFTFNTRPLSSDPCQRPIVFFFDRVERNNGGKSTTTTYGRAVAGKKKVCKRPEFVAASKTGTITIVANKMDPRVWKTAPRRQCCEASPSWGGETMEVRVRKCRSGEHSSPPKSFCMQQRANDNR